MFENILSRDLLSDHFGDYSHHFGDNSWHLLSCMGAPLDRVSSPSDQKFIFFGHVARRAGARRYRNTRLPGPPEAHSTAL